MRDIKFRGWNKEQKIMVDLHAITPLALDDMMNTQMSIMGIDGLFIPFDPKIILMQFTGLTNKNGVDIYEGDIVECRMSSEHFSLPHIGEIVYMEEFGAFATKNQAGETLLHNHQLNTFDVVGNIHQNPELLDG